MTSKIWLVARDQNRFTGIGRYAYNLAEGLENSGVDVSLITPSYPLPGFTTSLAKRAGFDSTAFFKSYAFRLDVPSDGIVHLTTQTLSTVLALKQPLRTVITIHDILPFILRDTPGFSHYNHVLDRWFDNWAMHLLNRANRLVAVSEFTKQTLIEHLRLPAERIDVIYYGIDHETFFPDKVDEAFKAEYGLLGNTLNILYVGSEQPRKNFLLLLRAFARVQKNHPNIRLVKVGQPEMAVEREKALQLIRELGVESSVIFCGHVGDDLAKFYNLAHIFVFPSLYEGFGFPPLEAMACGVPVICSTATSLPEVTGDAALLFDPQQEDQLVAHMETFLTDENLRQEYIQKGKKNAQKFEWKTTAQNHIRIYEKLLGKSLI